MSALLTSVAIQVHDLEAMAAFYAEAFGATFETVDVGHGLAARFGRAGGLLIKLVKLRDAADFEGFPTHQLGFRVDDVARVVEVARRHGGRVEGEVRPDRACVRDPDGNTLE